MVGVRCFLFFLLISISCVNKKEIEEEDPQRLRNEIPATAVQTVMAQREPFEYLIRASGKVQSLIDVQIQCKTTGIIKHVFVTNGSMVRKGALLAELENEKQTLQLEKARVQLDEKKVAYSDQILSYTKSDDSLKFQKAKENIRITGGLASAEIAYREAMLEYENTFIRATVTGIVSNLEGGAGSALAAGQVFCQVYDPDKLVVISDVLEADALKLYTGASAEITTLSETTGKVKAILKEINLRVDENTNLVKVILQLTSSKNLFPGMSVQATLKVPYDKNIIVPKEAVVIRSGRQVVFTAENGLAKWNYVTVGRENGKEIEILEGLKENQSVIITNNLQLAHDAPLNIIK